MGTRERKQREFDAREQLFLQRARELIRGEGLLSLQMARLAQGCDYATGTLYQHFASKEDLILALATEDVAHRATYFERVAGWERPSRDRMSAIAIADSWYLRTHPDVYRVAQYATVEVVWERASEERRLRYIAACEPIATAVHEIVRQALAAGDLPASAGKPETVSFGCWSMSIGTHALVHTQGVLEHYDIRMPFRLMLHHMQHLLNGMLWQPLASPAELQPKHLDSMYERVRKEVFHDAPSH